MEIVVSGADRFARAGIGFTSDVKLLKRSLSGAEDDWTVE
jgi:hypothetical protein